MNKQEVSEKTPIKLVNSIPSLLPDSSSTFQGAPIAPLWETLVRTYESWSYCSSTPSPRTRSHLHDPCPVTILLILLILFFFGNSFFFIFSRLTRFSFGETARVRVRELKRAGQQRAQVGYAQQHERHAEQRVHHGDDFALRRFRCQITVAWKQTGRSENK